MLARARAARRRLRRSFGPLYMRPRGRRQAGRTRVTRRRKSFKQPTARTCPLLVLKGVASSPHTLTEAPPYARLRTSQIDRATSSHPPPDERRPTGASGHIVARGEGAADLAVVEDAIEGALDAA